MLKTCVIRKPVIYLPYQNETKTLIIMKTLEKFIDFISVLLYGNQKSVTQKHF